MVVEALLRAEPKELWLSSLLPLRRAAAAAAEAGLACKSRLAAAADAAGDDGGWASHEVAWCRRPEGDIAIHRFQLSPGTSTQDLVRSLETMVREDMRAEKRCDPASNVDGFHGNRDLWLRPEFHELTLPWLIGEAVTQASQFEAEQLGQDPVATTCDESWFNVTGPYGWNQLHTHAGSKVACVFFIADGGCCSTADQLGGRLAFVTNEPRSVLRTLAVMTTRRLPFSRLI